MSKIAHAMAVANKAILDDYYGLRVSLTQPEV